MGSSRLTVLPTSWRVAGRRFFEPGGRPGPGLPGFGALARSGSAWRMLRNPRRTRAGVRRPGGQGRCQGRRVADLGDFGFIEFIADEAKGLVRVYHLVWTG